MDVRDFRALVTATAQRCRADAALFDLIEPSLPELPEGADYIALTSFAAQTLAAAHLQIITVGRSPVGSLLDLFPPVPVVRNNNPNYGTPFSRPRDSVSAIDRAVGEMYETFPVNFNAYYTRGEIEEKQRHTANLVWYSAPRPTEFPLVRMVITCVVYGDPSRIYEDDRKPKLPTGGEVMIDPTVDAEGRRSANVFWPVQPMSEWLAEFVGEIEAETPEDEWAPVIGE